MKLSTFKELIRSIEQGKMILEEHLFRNQDAEFIGYQEFPNNEPIAIFNVLKNNHPNYKSTVTAKTLNKLNLKIPDVPSFKSWKEFYKK